MAGSVEVFLYVCLVISGCLSSPVPGIEKDFYSLMGEDSVPVKVQDAAYVNPFKRKRSVVRYNDVETNEKDPIFLAQTLTSNAIEDNKLAEDSEFEWGTESDEDELSFEELEALHLTKSTGSNYTDNGVRRCQEYIQNTTVDYTLQGYDSADIRDDKMLTAGVYLCKFGYMRDGGNLVEALKEFQRFSLITPTGLVDEKTLKVMKLPRCGDSDSRTPLKERRRKRWANSDRKWEETELRYYIGTYTNDLPRRLQRAEIQRAFKMWSQVANVDFKQQKRYNSQVDLVLSFQYFYHRDDFSFDGTGGELAHAFLPEAGVIHFDDSEYWTSSENYGINLYTVAAHEVGHSLGLEHTSKRGALMSPFYDDFSTEKAINPDDIVSIQNLYGWRGEQVQYRCPEIIRWDTAFTDQITGSSFAFYQEQVWKFNENGLLPNYPQLTVSEFQGMPSVKVDASLAFKNGWCFLFAENRYYKYNATTGIMADGYPRPISLWGLDKNTRINDVIRWPRNNYVYFFTVDKYWRYNSAIGKMDKDYPQPLYLWQGVPTNFDGSMTTMDGSYTFFFMYHYYFPFNNRKARVEIDQVQEIKYSFFLCEEVVSEETERARFLKTAIEEVEETMTDENWQRFKRMEIDISEGSSAGITSLSTTLLILLLLHTAS